MIFVSGTKIERKKNTKTKFPNACQLRCQILEALAKISSTADRISAIRLSIFFLEISLCYELVGDTQNKIYC